jgi:GNAT superfamily N-acetyltransferase
MRIAFVGAPAPAEPLRDLVNAAYDEGEAGLWRPGRERLTLADAADCIARRELAAASDDDAIVGCVRVGGDARTGELGLLAVARGAVGRGVGGALVRFAEETARERGATAMRLELLVPRVGTHPAKERLHAWYTRLGYRAIERAGFARTYPEAARELAVPCDLVTYEKPLGGAGERLAG